MRQIRTLFLLLYFTYSLLTNMSLCAIWADNTLACYWYTLLLNKCFFKAIEELFLNIRCLRNGEERKRVRCVYSLLKMTLNGNINPNKSFVIFLFPTSVGEWFAVSLVYEAGQNWSYLLSQKFMRAKYVHKSIL